MWSPSPGRWSGRTLFFFFFLSFSGLVGDRDTCACVLSRTLSNGNVLTAQIQFLVGSTIPETKTIDQRLIRVYRSGECQEKLGGISRISQGENDKSAAPENDHLPRHIRSACLWSAAYRTPSQRVAEERIDMVVRVQMRFSSGETFRGFVAGPGIGVRRIASKGSLSDLRTYA